MNGLRRTWGRITEFLGISASAWTHTARVFWTRWSRGFRSALMPTQEWGRSDYDFWRKAYYCRAKGLEVSGLFIKPLCGKIAAWTLGRAPGWKTGDEAADGALAEWWIGEHAKILAAFRRALRQGDEFLVFNPDGTLVAIPPDLVEPIVAEDDFSRITGWRITQILARPDFEAMTRRMTVMDEYYADRRVRRTQIDSGPERVETFANPLGLVPVIHIANAPDDGQMFGQAEAEPLLQTLHRYGQIFDAAIEGNILQGRPTPVLSFASAHDLAAFEREFGSEETHQLPDGTSERVAKYDIDLSQLLTVSGATFDYKSPGSFSQDTERLLGLMFYLILEHTEIPEFVFGNAIASSQASAETQMPVFERYIEMRRADIGGWLTEIAQLALRWLTLTTPGLGGAGTPTIQWQRLTQNGMLTLDTLKWAVAEGLLDERTALMLAPVEVNDIDGVLETAREERAERERRAIDPMQSEFDREIESEIEAETEET